MELMRYIEVNCLKHLNNAAVSPLSPPSSNGEQLRNSIIFLNMFNFQTRAFNFQTRRSWKRDERFGKMLSIFFHGKFFFPSTRELDSMGNPKNIENILPNHSSFFPAFHKTVVFLIMKTKRHSTGWQMYKFS